MKSRKDYNAITETYCQSHGLKRYEFRDYLGQRRVAFLPRAEAVRRGLEQPVKTQRTPRTAKPAQLAADLPPVINITEITERYESGARLASLMVAAFSMFGRQEVALASAVR